MRRALRRLPRRIGRRGRCLLAFALADFIYGSWLANPTPSDRQGATFEWFSAIAPMQTWAVLWWTAGAICVYHAFHRFDRFGFTAAMGIKVFWALLVFAGWKCGDIPLGWVGIWISAAMVVHVIAGWREPEPYGDDAT
jgi:hypothetical protein